MDPFSSSSSSSSSSYSSSSFTASASFPIKEKSSSVAAYLHSVAHNKHLAKPWRKPILPPPRVYRVHSSNFREVVQKLTGKPEPTQPQHPQSVALRPSPLKISSYTTSLAALQQPMIRSIFVEPKNNFSDATSSSDDLMMSSNSFGGLASPSWFPAWCSVPLLSPGTDLPSLEPSTVL